MVARLHRCKVCRNVLPLVESARLDVDSRIERGDNLAAYDVIGEVCNQLADIRRELAVTLVEDADALDRLRELERLKPAYGVEPIIHGGREAGEKTQETAGLEAGGKECRRIGTCKGACPRATVGQRGGRKATC